MTVSGFAVLFGVAVGAETFSKRLRPVLGRGDRLEEWGRFDAELETSSNGLVRVTDLGMGVGIAVAVETFSKSLRPLLYLLLGGGDRLEE